MGLRYYRVESPRGYEGTFTLLALILQFADSRGWRPGEVQRIADLERGVSTVIEELTITRSKKA